MSDEIPPTPPPSYREASVGSFPGAVVVPPGYEREGSGRDLASPWPPSKEPKDENAKAPEKLPEEEEETSEELLEARAEEAEELIDRLSASIPECDIHDIGGEAEGELVIRHAPSAGPAFVDVEVELANEFQFRWAPESSTVEFELRLDRLVVVTLVPLSIRFDVHYVLSSDGGPCEGFHRAVTRPPFLRTPPIEVPGFTRGAIGREVALSSIDLLTALPADVDRRGVAGLVVKVNVDGFLAFPLQVEYRIATEPV